MATLLHPTRNWKNRVPELLALEGWYACVVNDKASQFKISCRFKDILRASRSKHFVSCFREGGMHEAQRELRLHDPNWAIAYLPDKHGDFMARAFIEFVSKVQLVNDPYNTCGCITCVSARRDRAAQEINHVKVYKIYGNGLSHETIMNSIMGKYNMECRPSLDDKYLSEY